MTENSHFAAVGRYIWPTLSNVPYVAAILALTAQSVFAQDGPVPSYISSLSAYEVVSLDGLNAPANANVTMMDITPVEWQTGDPGTTGLRSVIIAWNGGAKGIGSKLFVHGGGHNDSANNGLYIYDFSGTQRPEGWLEPLIISPVSAVTANAGIYSDGLPAAVHTYDGLVYAHHNNHIYRFAGSQYNNGFMTKAAYKFNEAAKVWSRVPDYPSSGGGAKTIYDASSGKIFVTMNDSLVGHFYRTASDSWSDAKNYSGNGFPFNSMGAWDSSRGRGIIVGAGETSLLNADFALEEVEVSTFEVSGDTEIVGRNGISAVYDPVADSYWIFGGSTDSFGWTEIAQMNADGPPWSIKATALTGSSIERTSGMIGSWGRYVLMPRWRALGIVASESAAAYVVRLPGELVRAPKPPTDLFAE